MRDRLIELLNGATDKNGIYLDKIADYLLANGVIVPPCKVGDNVYIISNGVVEECVITEWFYTTAMEHRYGFYAEVNGDSRIFVFVETDINKTVFLTKEEAEQALKGGKQV